MSDTQPTAAHDGAAPERPPSAQADSPASGATSIVEVQFKPEMARFTPGVPHASALDMTSAEAEWDLRKWTGDGGVQEVLARHGVQGSAPSFYASPKPFLHGSAAELEDLDVSPGGEPGDSDFQRFEFPSPEAASAAAMELSGLDAVIVARQVSEPGPPAAINLPNDPLIGTEALGVATVPGQNYRGQWYLHRTEVPGAWNLGAFGQNVIIADVDWGCRDTHVELKDRLMYRHWMYDGSTEVTGGPEEDHGTGVLGIAGAAANGKGICGYAPEAELWMVRGDSPKGVHLGPDPWANAIRHVQQRDSGGRRKVLLLQVQTRQKGRNFEQFPAVAKAIRDAIESDIVVCVAAGNGNSFAHLADDDREIDATGSILVGATAWNVPDPKRNPREPNSNFGLRVDVCAPGDRERDVTCDGANDSDYRNGFGGTSGAAAKVAGTIALMLSVNPGLSHAQVRKILKDTGTNIDADTDQPIGVLINARKAVEAALSLLPHDQAAPQELDDAA
jgi:subtilisin family serine protease